MWQKIKCWYRKNFNIYKTWSFWNKSIHFAMRTGYNCESIIGIKYQYHRCDNFCNLWIFLWFVAYYDESTKEVTNCDVCLSMDGVGQYVEVR